MSEVAVWCFERQHFLPELRSGLGSRQKEGGRPVPNVWERRARCAQFATISVAACVHTSFVLQTHLSSSTQGVGDVSVLWGVLGVALLLCPPTRNQLQALSGVRDGRALLETHMNDVFRRGAQQQPKTVPYLWYEIRVASSSHTNIKMRN